MDTDKNGFFDTGLRLEGGEIWAHPPTHYRHYFQLSICDSGGAYVTLVVGAPRCPSGLTSWEGRNRFADRDFVGAEADAVTRWWNAANAKHIEDHPAWYAAEAAETRRQAVAACPVYVAPDTQLECYECGAEYSAPGSVHDGGMSCRRCS